MDETALTAERWLIRIACPPAQAVLLQELLWTLEGVETVSETYHPHAETDETQPQDLAAIVLTTANVALKALLPSWLAEQPGLSACEMLTAQAIREEDWAESWKQFWHPTRISEELIIVPSWEPYQLQGQERAIRLDPGCAFGTGTHETTRLMLRMLDARARQVDLSQAAVLDVGTGSGILAIEAALLGCRDITAIDIDPLAIRTASQNAERNGVSHCVSFSSTPLNALCRRSYEVILANIIAPVILELWQELLQRLAPGGCLLLSGLVSTSVASVRQAMACSGLTEIASCQEGDWYALSGNRPLS